MDLIMSMVYHKRISRKFKKRFKCLGENTEKYITFTVSIEKEVRRINRNGGEIMKNISFILTLIDKVIFTVSSLSNLVNNLSERVHRIKYKLGNDDKKCEVKYK